MNDHDLLIRIDERQKETIERIDDIKVSLCDGNKRFEGHDGRIKKLEVWRGYASGSVAVILLGVGYISDRLRRLSGIL